MKSQMNGFANGEDCISNLPERVISHILSCLPIKDAVRTCVLSKDWEFKWTSIYDIKIDDSYFWEHNKASFVNYVDRMVLLLHNVKRFRLQCWNDCDSSRMIGWISAVLRRNVENFELYYSSAERLLLPRCLLNNISLRRLQLEFPYLPCTFKVPSQNSFPNLLYLSLVRVEIRNELSNTDTLTFAFPVLKTIELRECGWLNVKFVVINAPALTKFVSQTSKDSLVDKYSINIVGGRVMDFESSGYFLENLTLTGSSVVHAALFNVPLISDFQMIPNGLRVRRLLKGFEVLEDFEVSGSIMLAISQAKGLAFPRFTKLRRLTLDGCTDIEVLLELLHAAPYLKSLVVRLIKPVPYDYKAVESLPYCLLNQLEEVEFLYQGLVSMYDYLLEKFLLRKGLRLKAFHLRRSGRNKKNEVLEILGHLMSFPKGSDCLAFVVR